MATPHGFQIPRPVKGKGLIIAGAAGGILLAGASIISVVFFLLGPPNFLYYWDDYPYTYVISGILVFSGIVVFSITYLGFYVHHKSSLGLATFIHSIVASILFVVLMFLSVKVYDGWGPYGYYIDGVFLATASTILGVGIILMGITNIVDRKFLTEEGLFMSSGIIYIISGSFIISFLMTWIIPAGWILLFTSTLLASIGLFISIPHLGRFFVRGPSMVPVVPAPYGSQEPVSGVRFCPHCGGETIINSENSQNKGDRLDE